MGFLLTAESLAESPAEGRDEKIAVEFVDALTGRSHIYTMRTTDCFAAAFRSCEVMVEPLSLHQFYYDGNQLNRRYCPLDLPDFAEAPRIDYKRSSEGGGGKEYMREYGSYHEMHVGETIALCSSGDGRACWGQAKLHRVEGPLEDDRFKELQDQHCVHAPSCEAVQHKMSWKHVYAWHLSEVEVYETPLPYKNEHSVIWLDVRKAVADLAAA